jgi:hypothetical protein
MLLLAAMDNLFSSTPVSMRIRQTDDVLSILQTSGRTLLGQQMCVLLVKTI